MPFDSLSDDFPPRRFGAPKPVPLIDWWALTHAMLAVVVLTGLLIFLVMHYAAGLHDGQHAGRGADPSSAQVR